MQLETVGRVLLQGRLLVDSRKQSANVESHGSLVPGGATEARRREAVKKIGRGRGTEGQIESRGLGVVKMLPTKPADLSWIPRAYMLK